MRCYNTVLKPECLSTTETLILNRKKEIEAIQKKERQMFRKVLGPKPTNTHL